MAEPIITPGPALPTAAAFAAVRALAARAVAATIAVHDRGDLFESDVDRRVGWPVDWARVRVVSIAWQIVDADDGESADYGWRVLIADADPDAHALRSLIRDALADVGYPNVEVATKW